MIELYYPLIEESCTIASNHFPFTIIDIFKSITNDSNLEAFPLTKKFENNKRKSKIPPNVIEEITDYFFYEAQEDFWTFLINIISQDYDSYGIQLHYFILEVNEILCKNLKIKVDMNGIMRWIPNIAKEDVFLDKNVPNYIFDYFSESLDCKANELHRSSILFCTFALEASLKYKYLQDGGKNTRITFDDLIKWGIDNKLIEVTDFNKPSFDFLRYFRNDLVHSNLDKTSHVPKRSRQDAKLISKFILQWAELFINSIFKDPS